MACCTAVNYFRWVYAGGPYPSEGGATESEHLAAICDERGCFDGYGAILGTDALEDTCRSRHEGEPNPSLRNRGLLVDNGDLFLEFRVAPSKQRGLLQNDGDDADADAEPLLTVSCVYDSYCVGDFCYPEVPKPDGTQCVSSSDSDAVAGRCATGVCSTTPRCAEYDGGDVHSGGDGGICESFGLEVGTLVYIKPSPLSYFSLEDDAYGVDHALDTLHTFMQTQLAISHHTFYECQLPHLLFACATTYPLCTIVDQRVGQVVEYDSLEHGHLVSRRRGLQDAGTYCICIYKYKYIYNIYNIYKYI
jgi:hypothetical protein